MNDTLNQHLFLFAAEGDPIGVRIARGFGADLFATDENGYDAMTIALLNGHDETARVIEDMRSDHVGRRCVTRH